MYLVCVVLMWLKLMWCSFGVWCILWFVICSSVWVSIGGRCCSWCRMYSWNRWWWWWCVSVLLCVYWWVMVLVCKNLVVCLLLGCWRNLDYCDIMWFCFFCFVWYSCLLIICSSVLIVLLLILYCVMLMLIVICMCLKLSLNGEFEIDECMCLVVICVFLSGIFGNSVMNFLLLICVSVFVGWIVLRYWCMMLCSILLLIWCLYVLLMFLKLLRLSVSR